MPLLHRPPSRFRVFLARLLRAAAIGMGLVALGLTSGYVAMQSVMERDRVEVPQVIGLDSVAASALMSEAGLTPRVVAEEFSNKIAKGHVTNQRPSRRARVKPGSEVRLFISRGTDQLEVPNVTATTLLQAQRSLAEAGLTLGRVTRIHSDAHQREAIIAQSPSAGTTATRGAPVALLQSLGPWEETTTMPDLLGREMVTALNLLKELQVEARLTFEQSASRQGHVVAQDPPPGTPIKIGAQVQMTIGD